MRNRLTGNVGVLTVCAGMLFLSSCTKVSNGFVIKDAAGTIFSAELRLCNKRVELIKSGGEFRGEMPITCEGDGSILVHLADGRETVCKVGYVTPGAEQNFQYAIEHGTCRPISDQR